MSLAVRREWSLIVASEYRKANEKIYIAAEEHGISPDDNGKNSCSSW